MPQVLTTNAVILCPHGGKGTSTPSDPKWSVNGGFVLLEGDQGVLACPNVIYPCVGYRLRSMGLNATRIGARKVILSTDFNQSFTGLPLVMTETHKMIDNSTPAAIPPGQAAPPLQPAMLDLVQPIVTGTPPALAFSITTMLPPTLAATFTLTSAFPLKWVLTLINEALQTDANITDGLPPGLVVAPAGGDWNSPTLAITLTMTAAFMAALTVGTHRFYMTAVSQRGLSGVAQIVLTVSL